MQETQAVADLEDLFPLADPPPAAVIAAANATLALRTPGAEIAALVFDSILGDEAVHHRGDDPSTRVLLFVAPGLALTVGTRRLLGGTELRGQYISSTDFEVHLRLPGIGTITLDQLSSGGFAPVTTPQSTVSFILVARLPQGTTTIVTDPVVV
jgi:hypothetical protein